MYRICRLWPGLPGLLRYARWPFFWIALLFFFLLDSWLVLNFYWTHYLSSGGRWGTLLFLFFAWIVLGSIAAGMEKRIERTLGADADSSKFLEALKLYLRAGWFESECLLNELLQKNPRDLEARLLLATLYRHTRRFPDALDTLKTLQRCEESGIWIVEIEAEKRLIGEAIRKTEEEEKESEKEAEPVENPTGENSLSEAVALMERAVETPPEEQPEEIHIETIQEPGT